MSIKQIRYSLKKKKKHTRKYFQRGFDKLIAKICVI